MPGVQSKRWCFTINNYNQGDVDRLVALDHKYLIFGREVAATGTPHLQGYVEFNARKRFNSVKSLLGVTAHISAAKGSASQNKDYCSKEGDFEEFGEPAIAKQGKRSDWDDFRAWLKDFGRRPTQRELINEFPHLWARYSGCLDQIVSAFLPDPTLCVGEPRPGWQSELLTLVDSTPDDRTIEFYVDPDGNTGKTYMCTYLMTKHPARVQYLRIGKRDDLAFAIECTKDVFLFDVPRSQMEFLQYSVLEMLKDRMIFSPKYQSMTKVLSSTPHVIVFSNEPPDDSKLSADRYIIKYITNS